VPVWHEELRSNVAEENVLFAIESAERAVIFLIDVFCEIFGSKSTLDPQVAAWVHSVLTCSAKSTPSERP